MTAVILSEFEYPFPSSNRPPSPDDTGVLPALELSGNEQTVFAVLGKEELSIEDVIRKCDLPAAATSVALSSFEMKRLIRQLGGGMFLRNSCTRLHLVTSNQHNLATFGIWPVTGNGSSLVVRNEGPL